MKELDQLRSDVLAMFPTVVGVVDRDLTVARRAILDHARGRLEAGRYFVVVCGEFKRGKSSLLNALVDRKGLFPVDMDVATSTICTLQWGDEEQAVAYFAPADAEHPDVVGPPQLIGLDDVARYVTEQGNPGNLHNILRVEMSARIEHLRSGMVLVDTPGVGSINAAHTAATRAFLPNADAILFVASAAQPLGTVELDFLRHALEMCPIVVTAVTMTDKVVTPEPVVAETRTRIAKVAGIAEDDLVIVGVSSLRKRNSTREEDPELLVESGFPALEEQLWEGLAATCGAAQLGAAIDGLDAAVADGESPVLNELAALAGDDELARVDAELQAEQSKVKELRSNANRWKDRLRKDVDARARLVQDELTAAFDAVREDFKIATKGDSALKDPNAVVRRTSELMVDAAERANQSLAAALDEIAERYAKETSVALTAARVGSAGSDIQLGEVTLDAPVTTTRHAKFRTIWGGGSAGGAAGAATGFVLGSFLPVIGNALGALVGGVIGQIVGMFGGKKQAALVEHERQEREHRREMREQVLPRIESARKKTERDLSRQVHDAGSALTAALTEQVNAAGESLTESVARLQATRKRTAAQRADRERELIGRQQGYADLRSSLDGLRGRVGALVRRERAE